MGYLVAAQRAFSEPWSELTYLNAGLQASEVRTLLRALRLDSVTLSEYFHEVIRSLGGSPTKGAKRARGAG